MSSRWPQRMGVAAFAIVSVGGSVAVSSSLLPGGPAQEEVSSLARDGGLTAPDARAELRDEGRIARFAEEARARLGGLYGGTYVVAAPTPRITVALVRDASPEVRDTLRHLLTDAAFERPVSVVEVQHGEAELLDLQRTLERGVAPLNAAADSTVDVEVDLAASRVLVHAARHPSPAQREFLATVERSSRSVAFVVGPDPSLSLQPRALRRP